MEEVILSSDILIHYFVHRVGENLDWHKQATAVMQRVYAGQLKAHISDIVFFQVAKHLEEANVSDLAPKPYTEYRAQLPQYERTYEGTDAVINRMYRYLRPLLKLPTVLNSDKQRLIDTLFYHGIYNLGRGYRVDIETAYNIAAMGRLKPAEWHKIQGIVTFRDLAGAADSFVPRIDPDSFL